jgi:hypothetical protein
MGRVDLLLETGSVAREEDVRLVAITPAQETEMNE